MKINDFLHNFGCGGLEVHLSRSSCVEDECNKSAFRRFATERLSVGNTGSVYASGVTLGNRVLNGKHVKHKVEEEKGGDNGDHRTKRGDVVSTSKCVRVVGDTAGHSGKTKEVHGEEGKVYTNKEGSEVDLT